MNERSYKFISELANKINMNKDPAQRINIVNWLADGIGHVLMTPSPVIEQTISTLEKELEELKKYKGSDSPVAQFILENRKLTISKSNKVLGLLKAFQEVRPHIKKRLIEYTGCGPDDIPD